MFTNCDTMGDSLAIKRNELSMQTWMNLNITVPNGRRETWKHTVGTFQVVQRLKLRAPNAGGTSLISCWWTKIPHATRHSPIKSKTKTERETTLYSEKACSEATSSCAEWSPAAHGPGSVLSSGKCCAPQTPGCGGRIDSWGCKGVSTSTTSLDVF